MTTIKRYEENPTVISMEKNYQDWNTTFPSMTVCPNNTYDAAKLELLLEEFRNLKVRNAVEKIMIFLSKTASYEGFDPELLELAPIFPIPPSRYLEYVNKIIHNFTYNAHDSNGGTVQLEQNWSEIGNCYSYNTMVSTYNNYDYWTANDWNITHDYSITYGNPLDGEIFTDVTEMNALPLIYLHGYNDVPDISARPRLIKEAQYAEFDLGIWSIYSTSETLDLSVSQRRCRFMNESNLAISPAYTYGLCRMECRAKKALELCGCVPHFYRTTPRGVSWTRCDMSGYACLQTYSDLLLKLRNTQTGEKVDCKCLPPCDDIAFVVHKDKPTDWFLTPTFKLGVTNYPRMRLKRDILFGLTDLFVSIGGTAGLFLGCSVLSFIELFYYFTLRLFWFVHDRMKQSS